MRTRTERKDAAEHRKLILSIAESLFTEYGVDEVSMHQIAKTAGVGQGTLYRRYAHKGDLCMDILQDFSQDFIARARQFLSDNEGLTPEERLGWLLDSWIDMIEQKSDLIAVIEAHQHKTKVEAGAVNFFQSELYLTLRAFISSLLSDIAARGSQLTADPDISAHALICSMAPAGYFHLKREYGCTTQELKNNYRRMCQLPVDTSDRDEAAPTPG